MSSTPAYELDEIRSTLPDSDVVKVSPQGRRMLDRYEVIAEIARGGMGTVYLARLAGAGGFERLMAIKLMHEHLAHDEQFVMMLLDEARTAANIHHPNAVGIVDIASSPVGYYLVMNYVEGFSLWHVMTHPALDARERIRLTTRLIADALHGLHAAHTARDAKGEKLDIVHRDVSPQNVLVGTDGVGRIVDFGIALAASRVAYSRPGVLKGKPSYMAPEQARGESCDARTDLFAMGVVLWESLVNERLFWAEMDVAVLVQVMDCNVDRPDARNPLVPSALADVAMQALSRALGDRFASARDFAVALEKAAQACDLMASSPEVEEKLKLIFAEEVQDKQAAVTAHLMASEGAAVPLQRGQLHTIPKLTTKQPTPRELPTRAGASGIRPRTTPTPVSLASNEVVREPSVEVSALAYEEAQPLRVSEASPSLAMAAPPETSTRQASSSRLWPLAVGLGITLALALGVAFYLAQQPEAGVISEPLLAAPATRVELEAAPVALPTAPTLPEPALAPSDPPHGVDLPPAAPTAPIAAPVDDTASMRAHPRVQPSEPTTTPAATLEENPYLTH